LRLHRHPNPVHTLRVCWNSSEEEVVVKYKMHDLEAEWYPKKIYDLRLKRWVPDPNMQGWTGVLLNLPDTNDIPKLRTEHWEFMGVKHAINDIPSMSRAELRSWEGYWSTIMSAPFEASVPWSLASMIPCVDIQSSTSNTDAAVPQVLEEGELFVVGGPSATGWERSRKKKPKHIAEGDILVYIPNDDDIEADSANGYYLPLSFARVESIEYPKAQVIWMFAEHFDTEFIPWANRTQSIDVKHFAKDSSGRFVKVHLDDDTATLTPASILDVKNLVSTDEFEKHSKSIEEKASRLAAQRQKKRRNVQRK
jgi:hypothetical protein